LVNRDEAVFRTDARFRYVHRLAIPLTVGRNGRVEGEAVRVALDQPDVVGRVRLLTLDRDGRRHGAIRRGVDDREAEAARSATEDNPSRCRPRIPVGPSRSNFPAPAAPAGTAERTKSAHAVVAINVESLFIQSSCAETIRGRFLRQRTPDRPRNVTRITNATSLRPPRCVAAYRSSHSVPESHREGAAESRSNSEF